MINDFKTKYEQNIQLTVAINFLSSKDTSPMLTVHYKNDNLDVMIGNQTNEIIEEFFHSVLQKHQKAQKNQGSEFVFDGVDLLHYKCHKITLNCCLLHIGSPKLLKPKKQQ